MKVGELIDVLQTYDDDDDVVIDVYDIKSGKYMGTDEHPTLDDQSFDINFIARVPVINKG